MLHSLLLCVLILYLNINVVIHSPTVDSLRFMITPGKFKGLFYGNGLSQNTGGTPT